MSLLFSPIQLGTLTLKNRIIVAPMCQYSAEDNGEITAWHRAHWMNMALSGAGLFIVEATTVQENGGITYADLGLWNDPQKHKMQQALAEIRQFTPMPIAIQLAHAGRKASTEKPWHGGQQIPANQPHGWQTVAPSALTFDPEEALPHTLDLAGIKQVQQDFAKAAQRAVDAGFELIELHSAHGYLLHQFLSPLSNQRHDEYGGSLQNRLRMVLETFTAIKAAVPEGFPVGVRISGTDWINEPNRQGWDIASSIALSQQLEQLGAAYIHVSSGGLDIQQKIEVKDNYQVPFADAIKQQVNIPVIAVGLITKAQQAEAILQNHQADAIAVARAMLYDPRWPWHVAAELKEKIAIAPQYLRSQPHGLKKLFEPF
ncbi:NADH:flavin oxidoreductase/NADH oxidase [Alkanindiges illinoisensis]|uniref:NADH:flavin oxidoreductase/NADH oxidase n=1 Tax=Alkanindiges illinoisensis TaxID=197183 RepID=UPI00047DAAB3|nr:NADH:flavin oxidoreductase/NADH oxidase [Alkanindiges illinoisensis]